jgi:hypothetical protein
LSFRSPGLGGGGNGFLPALVRLADCVYGSIDATRTDIQLFRSRSGQRWSRCTAGRLVLKQSCVSFICIHKFGTHGVLRYQPPRYTRHVDVNVDMAWCREKSPSALTPIELHLHCRLSANAACLGLPGSTFNDIYKTLWIDVHLCVGRFLLIFRSFHH